MLRHQIYCALRFDLPSKQTVDVRNNNSDEFISNLFRRKNFFDFMNFKSMFSIGRGINIFIRVDSVPMTASALQSVAEVHSLLELPYEHEKNS